MKTIPEMSDVELVDRFTMLCLETDPHDRPLSEERREDRRLARAILKTEILRRLGERKAK